MFKATVVNSIGLISPFEFVAMKQSIGACEKINDLNSGEKINVMAAVVFHVENDKIDDGEYYCCVFKVLGDKGDIVYMSTGSQSAIESVFDAGDTEDLFANMPEDMDAIVFKIKKQPSKKNQGSFIILLPIEYLCNMHETLC